MGARVSGLEGAGRRAANERAGRAVRDPGSFLGLSMAIGASCAVGLLPSECGARPEAPDRSPFPCSSLLESVVKGEGPTDSPRRPKQVVRNAPALAF